MSSKADLNSDDYYKVLGVGKGASDAELGKAYKKLALKHHPDKNPDRKEQAEEEFKKLTEAYDVLRCPEKRKTYDQFGKAGLNGANPQSGEPDFSFGGCGGPQRATMSREDADKVFSAFFGGADPFGSIFGERDGSGPHFMFQTMGSGNGASRFHDFGSAGNMFDGMNVASSFPRSASTAGFHSGTRMRKGARHQSNTRPRSRRAHSRPQRPSEQHVVPCGTAVIIQGLTKSPEHNGKTGHVVDWDGVKGRYEVRVRLGDENMWVGDDRLWLQPRNITQLCTVEVTGLASKPELNGRRGEVFNYDESKRRYMVLLDGPGVAISLQPANCILTPGTCIVTEGLSKPECNGQRARIISIDRTAARYTVECENGKQIKIKYDNVLC